MVSNDEDQTRSLMGEIMFTYAKYQRKLGGLVLDGTRPGSDALREMDLPVYATGSTPVVHTRRVLVRSTFLSPVAASA